MIGNLKRMLKGEEGVGTLQAILLGEPGTGIVQAILLAVVTIEECIAQTVLCICPPTWLCCYPCFWGPLLCVFTLFMAIIVDVIFFPHNIFDVFSSILSGMSP